MLEMSFTLSPILAQALQDAMELAPGRQVYKFRMPQTKVLQVFTADGMILSEYNREPGREAKAETLMATVRREDILSALARFQLWKDTPGKDRKGSPTIALIFKEAEERGAGDIFPIPN